MDRRTNRKLKILWIADQLGWAYDSIYRQNSKLMPEFEHRLIFWNNKIEVATLSIEADVIVAMYIRYLELIPPFCHRKVVLMLTGLRPFMENEK